MVSIINHNECNASDLQGVVSCDRTHHCRGPRPRPVDDHPGGSLLAEQRAQLRVALLPVRGRRRLAAVRAVLVHAAAAAAAAVVRGPDVLQKLKAQRGQSHLTDLQFLILFQ